MAPQAGGKHLVVCSHGFIGWPVHLNTLIDTLLAHDKDLVILNSQSNSFLRSLDGVDVCGARLVQDVKRALQEDPGITRISLIGYSQGGLLMRYAAGCLFADGTFERVEPINFVTIATPHLGVALPATSAGGRFYNYIMGQMGARSGQHMLLADAGAGGVPLLVRMTIPDSTFMRGLALFRQRLLYANVVGDRAVPYCAASIQPHNKYRKPGHVFRPLPDYPSIVQLYHNEERAQGDDEGALDCTALLGQARREQRAIDVVLRCLKMLAVVLVIALLSPIILLVVLAYILVTVYSRANVALTLHHHKAPPEAGLPLAMTDELRREAQWRQLMLDNLCRLSWTRVDVYIPNAFDAHGLIITREPNSRMYRRYNTRDVLAHLAKAMIL